MSSRKNKKNLAVDFQSNSKKFKNADQNNDNNIPQLQKVKKSKKKKSDNAITKSYYDEDFQDDFKSERKRKQSESFEETPSPKKAKKKQKNDIEENNKKEIVEDNLQYSIIDNSTLKKKKKSKAKHDSFINVNTSESTFNDSSGLETNQKSSKTKNKNGTLQNVKQFNNSDEFQHGKNNISLVDLHTDSQDESETIKEILNKESKKINIKPMKKPLWPDEDLTQLIQRIEENIPENDVLAYSTRCEKLEWNSVAFNNYGPAECKEMWYMVQKQVRKFRILKEILADAKEWISQPKSKKKTKSQRHPDMPRKPLTAYIIFFLLKKDAFLAANPGMDAPELSKRLGQTFKNLSPEKRVKYELMAAKNKQEYEQKLEEFFQNHPEIPRKLEKAPRPLKERVPQRPHPPFYYYFQSELDKDQTQDKTVLKEKCKEKWKNMPDKKKIVWISLAEVEYAKFEESLKQYIESHPNYTSNSHKPILTKEEVQIKDRVAGKPVKPPNSAYNLFAQMLLQSSEIKIVNPKDRLVHVSNQWKNCSDEERQKYKDLIIKMTEKYKQEYASYLETLPEEERQLAVKKRAPKKVKAEQPKKSKPTDKKKKKKQKKKFPEPEIPPISSFKYFASKYTGEEPVSRAWKSLTVEQKRVYELELKKKKEEYIINFEKFLKSLTKEELEDFSNSRSKMKRVPMGENRNDEEYDGDNDEQDSDNSTSSEEKEDDDEDEDSD